MTPFRKWLLTAGITLALLMPLASIASADPGDPGGTTLSSISTAWSTSTSRGGKTTWTTTSLDPGDPGGTD